MKNVIALVSLAVLVSTPVFATTKPSDGGNQQQSQSQSSTNYNGNLNLNGNTNTNTIKSNNTNVNKSNSSSKSNADSTAVGVGVGTGGKSNASSNSQVKDSGNSSNTNLNSLTNSGNSTSNNVVGGNTTTVKGGSTSLTGGSNDIRIDNSRRDAFNWSTPTFGSNSIGSVQCQKNNIGIGAYGTSNDYGVQATYNIVLGGRNCTKAELLQLENLQLQNEILRKSLITVPVVTPGNPVPPVVPPVVLPEPSVCKPLSTQKQKDLVYLTKQTFKDGVITKKESQANAARYQQLLKGCLTHEQVWTLLDP